MNSTNFVNNLRRALIQLADAVDQVEAAVDIWTDEGDANCFDTHFSTKSYPADDPLTKADLKAAAGVVVELTPWLGAGAASRRDKLNKVR